MVSRSPGNVLRGKQTETGAKQPRSRETGVFLQLRCYTDDWQPSAVDTQLPWWLFRSSVPTPSKAHNLTLQIDLSWISACFYIQITCIKGVILFFPNRHLLVHMSTPDSFWDSSWMEPPSNLNQPSKNLKSSYWMCMMSWSKLPNKCQGWRQNCT